MKRGSRLFFELTSEKEPVSKKRKASKKRTPSGRSPVLLKMRDEKIFYRYFYYSKLLHYKYENVLAMLVYEFDLTESTIIQMIAKGMNRLKEVNEEKPTIAQLKRKYSYLSWNGKPVVVPGRAKPKEPRTGW